MIFQTLIRIPDKTIEEGGFLFGFRCSEDEAVGYCVDLLNDIVPPKITLSGLKIFPSGFVIEGVAYGIEEDEPIDAYDFDLKVLH